MTTKAFDPKKLPKGFPPVGMIKQHGKDYITHVGLVWLANHRGKPWNGAILDHDIKWNQNGQPIAAVVLFKVWDDEQEHTDIGDSTVTNVGGNIAPHLIRMASTRAQNRALRAFVGYAGCTADELALGGSYEESSGDAGAEAENGHSGAPAGRKEQGGPVPPLTIRTNSPHKCPQCGGALWDNREKPFCKSNGGRGPYFSCSRKAACPGGKGDNGWAEWENPDRFADVQETGDREGAAMFGSGPDADDAHGPVDGEFDGPHPHKDSDIPF